MLKLQIIQNYLLINILHLLLLYFVSNSIAISIINETESVSLSNQIFSSYSKIATKNDQIEKIKFHQKIRKTNYNETYAHMMMGLSGAAYAQSPNACMQRY
jgi:hypothetical protein